MMRAFANLVWLLRSVRLRTPRGYPALPCNGYKIFEPAKVATLQEHQSGVPTWVLVGLRSVDHDHRQRIGRVCARFTGPLVDFLRRSMPDVALSFEARVGGLHARREG